jgi:large conductance mechanosensitive channel
VTAPSIEHIAKRGHGFLAEFRAFAMRGNVVDLAVGVIIGAAFGKIISSLVDEVIMPPIGLLVGRVDFTNLEWVLRVDNPLTKVNEKVAIQYGHFLNTLIQFVLIAFVTFVLVKAMNRMREKEAEKPAAPPAPTPTEKLLEEIRDELKAQRSAQ